MKKANTIWEPAAVLCKASSLCHSLVRLVINWAFKTISVIKTAAILLAAGILICFYACKTGNKKITNSTKNTTNPVAQSLEQKLTDSLFKYIHLTEFLQRVDVSSDTGYVLYGKEINKNKIGLVVIESKTLLFFQNIKNKFTLTDSFAFDNYASSFDIIDLNGDNRQDFIVYGHWDIHGNNYPNVFMCDSNNILHYQPDIQMPNISYDWNTKLVHSYWQGGAFDVHEKEVYRWVDDTLQLVGRAELDLSHERYFETRLYKVVNGKEKRYKKSRKYSAELYDTAFFDIED